MTPELTLLLQQLSKRIDGLEELSYHFWVPLVVSVLALIVAYLSFRQGRNQAKGATLQAVKNNIDVAKSQIESLSMELAPLKAKLRRTADEEREFQIKTQVHDSALERLLNGYNDGCDKFFKKTVIQQDFIDLYHQDIALYIQNFPDKFSGPLTRFNQTLRYYEQRHKNVKA